MRQLEAEAPDMVEALTPPVPEFTVLSCTLRKAVVKIWTSTCCTGSAKEAATVTGPPVDGLGKTTGVALGWGVKVIGEVALGVEVELAAGVGVEGGVAEAVELGVVVGEEVGVEVGWTTVITAPATGRLLKAAGWPLFPLSPGMPKL